MIHLYYMYVNAHLGTARQHRLIIFKLGYGGSFANHSGIFFYGSYILFLSLNSALSKFHTIPLKLKGSRFCVFVLNNDLRRQKE